MRSSFFALAAVLATATALTYDNPVLDTSAPDPGVLFHQNKWWAAVTSNGDVNHFPLFSSDDLVSWKFETHLIPQGKEPSFCHDKNTDYWAPELHVGPAGDLFCYFVCRGNNGVLTVGVMLSSSGSPLGPWSDGSILVGDMSDGQIDASFFYVNATRQAYAIWKEDSNSIGKPTHIWIANTTDKATTVTSKPISLIYNDSPWEGAVTEGPWIIQDRGYFYLFYSGNAYNTKAYAIGVARATTITGPYEKYSKVS
jgi:arabinan endo-1,5-alpha-L-arabinosidase